MDFEEDIERIMPSAVLCRRHLHMHPEVGFDTLQTEAYIRDRLNSMGIEILPSSYGVLGLIRVETATEMIAFRADIDALDIIEENDVPYKSQVSGKMHACGHDGHTAMLLAAAEIMNRHRSNLAFHILLIFQPAEETPGAGRNGIPPEELPPAGAKAFMDEFQAKDKIKMIFGQHLFNNYPTGKILLKSGPMMASADQFEIEITGVSGHTSNLDKTVDALSVGCSYVKAMEAFVARQVNPMEPVTFSIGMFHSGTAKNVVAGRTEIGGTIRCQSSESRLRVFRRMEEILKAECDGMGADYHLKLFKGVPVLINDKNVTAYAREKAISVVGQENVSDLPKATMASEDFAYYSEGIPAAFIWIGSGNSEKGLSVLGHNSKFDFDEDAMRIGIRLWLALAMK